MNVVFFFDRMLFPVFFNYYKQYYFNPKIKTLKILVLGLGDRFIPDTQIPINLRLFEC